MFKNMKKKPIKNNCHQATKILTHNPPVYISKSNTAVLYFIPFVRIYHCLSVISIYKGTREAFVKILLNSFEYIKPSRKHCKIDASSSNTVLSAS